MSLTDWIVGRRLANRERHERRIGAFEGVPAMVTKEAPPGACNGPEGMLDPQDEHAADAVRGELQPGAGLATGFDQPRPEASAAEAQDDSGTQAECG